MNEKINIQKTIEKIPSKEFWSKFYLLDLFSNLIGKKSGRNKNIFAVIYLILNVGLVSLIFYGMVGDYTGVIAGILVYFIAAFIALSPVGEWFLRFQQGCKRIDDVNLLNRLEPLFMEVLERTRSKATEYSIEDSISLYIKEDPNANAFALGRRTVCVTTGLLACSDEEIKAILGHEMGHLASHDTDLILLITCGNMIVTVIFTVVKLFLILFKLITSIVTLFLRGDGLIAGIIATLYSFLCLVLLDLGMFLWSKLGILLVMKTSRNAEYDADAFSCDLGYADGLLSFFHNLLKEEYSFSDKSSLKARARVFSALADSHPSTKKRIDRIEKAIGYAK